MKFKWWLVLVLMLAFVVRVYRIDETLGFYYDQGRDAKVIWDLWHHGKFFLIGPTTGIEGIFRGPWYYWLIAPAYLLGRGSPVWPAVFLVLLAVAAVAWIYRLAVKISGPIAGIVALILSAFSFNLITDARWLSNPTPMLIISLAFIQSLLWVWNDKPWGWLGLGASWGLAMQFGSAAEIFYLPVMGYLLWVKRKSLSAVWLVAGAGAVVVAFLPQIIFDFRHQEILRSAIYRFLVTDSSFRTTFWETFKVRLPFYAEVFFAKIYPTRGIWWWIFGLVLGIALIKHWSKFNRQFHLIFFLLLSPLIGMLFFQGNFGNVYGYYFTGYYHIWLLVLSGLLVPICRSGWGKILLGILLVVFVWQNLSYLYRYHTNTIDRPGSITLGNQKQVIDWVYKNSQGADFNVDVYVPPVIPHAYDYLFLWLGTTKYQRLPTIKLVSHLYTIYEIDPPHPERLEAWLARQAGIGKVEEGMSFGGITVQRRVRI